MMAGVFTLFAGHETTTSILSNCYVHLAENPSHFKYLKAHPQKLEGFIEEALRFYTPVSRFLRRTKRDLELHGVKIPAQSLILLVAGAANTDPEKFEQGCRFDLHRRNAKQHLSFGRGAHFCLGAQLARWVIKETLSDLIQNAESLQIDKSRPWSMVTDRDNGVYRYDKLWATTGTEKTT